MRCAIIRRPVKYLCPRTIDLRDVKTKIADDILERVFKPLSGQSVPTMIGSVVEPSLQGVFGRAFLLQLQRGDLETAKVFARAFLLRSQLDSKRTVSASAAA